MFSDVFSQIESRFNIDRSGTGCYDPTARVAAISAVNNGIDVARQFLYSLLTYRNTLAPISALPYEILARVFHLLVLQEPPFTRRRNPVGWIRVTHVCRHWRQIALDGSSLWARIPAIPRNKVWISEMLARAKNAPLDVEFNAAARSSREALFMIPPHISHTRQLRLHDLSTRHSDIVQGICSCEAPNLEHFELTVDGYNPLSIFRGFSGNMLFKGHSPRLRTISISQANIPWSLVPRSQLTQLKIACRFEVVDFPGDLNELIDILVNCPGLETLALECCLPSQLAEFSPGRTIHLPHLSRLRLHGSTSRIMNMMKMLKLPSSTTLHLDCIFRTTDEDLEGLILPIISAQLQAPPSVEFKSLTATIQLLESSLQITASTFLSTLQNCQSYGFEDDIVRNPELVLSFGELTVPGHSTDLLKHACKLLPISNVQFISMSVSMSVTNIIDINWVELFSCFTNVTTMQAIEQGTSGFVRALTAPMVTNTGSSKEGGTRKQDSRNTAVQPASTVAHVHAVIFPNLKTLGLVQLNFNQGKHTPGPLFDVFERGLEQRMEASGPPLTLHLSNCGLSTEHANDLRKLVQGFHLDESEGSDDGFECECGADEQHLYSGGRVYVSHGTVLHDWDSDGYDDFNYDEL
jgi:hypothetical protein